ncbi:MAG TPA: class I SAM-dependent methyltransferase [Acidimicrobiales bacterium]|nr:class I SAM-dependent methyltransferase [Acidimicrobiales bacterium]
MGGWDDYLAAFHAERPGITEDVLTRALADDGRDAYDWLAHALPDVGLTVDVACGSGPLAGRVTGRWMGVDRHRAELGLAVAATPGRLTVGDAASLPVRPGAADAVACSMGLMLFDDPGAAAGEMARLLRPGGLLVVLLPTDRPLRARDRVRYARLLAALRLRRVPFRRPRVLADPRSLLAAAGLTVTRDEQRRFAFPFTDPHDGVLWLRSLYLPGLDARRWRGAQRVVGRWTGSDIGIPLRRLIAVR